MIRQASITQSDLDYMLLDETAESKALPLSVLSEITDDFSDKLEIGRGGFAIVYKATLEHGAVAVKRLSNTYMYDKEFQREVECLMKVKHKNIVRFLGYCADTQGNMESYNGKLVMADVQQRLLCFEFLPKGSLDTYIKDSPKKLEWRKRYHVIKGICEGLNYLHHKNILHLDLKPGNILLDEDMMPKITDFGLSRCFEEDQTRIITKNVGGTMGYLAPEFYSDEITDKFDLYSLGVIITEMLTGKKGYQTIEKVLEIWSNTMLDTLQWEQIRVCAKIGIECTEADAAKRPASMKHIIHRLAELECSTHVIPLGGTSELLLLNQFTLCFPFEPNKVITCPLQLTNKTDRHVAFRLMDKSMESSFLSLPLYGLVPPNTPYTLIVTTQGKKELPRKYIIDVILDSATLILGDNDHINTFQSQPDKFFQEMWNAVQEVKLKALYTLPRHITTSLSKPISPTIKIILSMEKSSKYALDTNQAKQWLIIGVNGHVGFWDYQTKRKRDSLKVSATDVIKCVKFIARKQWIVAGTNNGNVLVYDYEKMQKITSFRVRRFEKLLSLAVHPTQQFLLSAYGCEMKLWDWDKGWECVRTFTGRLFERACQVAFNPHDTFASASMDYTVEIWSLDSPKSNYALSGHVNSMNCLDFFTCYDQEFLVTGSDDHTAKIWNLQKKICAYTLEAFVSPVTSVLYQPNLHTLITGSEDGAIYLWGTTNFRIYSWPPTLRRIIKIGCVGAVYHLACAMGRVMIGKENVIAIMGVDNLNYQEQSTDYIEQQLSADTRQLAEDTASENISVNYNPDTLCSLDAHATEPWILTGHRSGYARIWHHEMKYPMNSFKVSEDEVSCVKFISRREWIVAITRHGDLHVYDCACVTKIENITSVKYSGFTYTPILAVQPILPYVLSPGIVLLDWELGWDRIQRFLADLITVAFNPRDANSFASGSYDGEVKIWRLDSPEPEYSFPGHSELVTSLDFITRGDQQYFITGSQDCTAKIWDLQKRECICTLEATSPVFCVLAHPNLPVLITGTEHGIIQIWSSNDFRLKKTINLGGGGAVVSLGCLTSSRRIVIGQENAISLMDIHVDEVTALQVS